MLFFHRKGIKPIKSVIQVDTIDADLRKRSVECFYVLATNLGPYNLMVDFCLGYFKGRLDDFHGDETLGDIQRTILHGEWYEVYDVLEFTVQKIDSVHATDFVENCNAALEKEISGYRFIGNKITKSHPKSKSAKSNWH